MVSREGTIETMGRFKRDRIDGELKIAIETKSWAAKKKQERDRHKKRGRGGGIRGKKRGGS